MMAVIGTITQQPADVLDYDVDCTDLLDGGDTLASVTSTATPSGLTVNSILGTDYVKVWVRDGVAGTSYKIEVTVTTTLGRTKQDELKVRIKEV
jgi:hypothetical protein